MTDRGYQRANDESRERLARLVETLTPARVAVDIGGGWTVASALAHMGFWDRWQAARWRETHSGEGIDPAQDTHALENLANIALDPLLVGIAPTGLAAAAIQAAEEVDGLAASAPDATVDAIEGGATAYLLHRHRHRSEHLDQIERGLTAAAIAPAPADRSFIEKNAASRRRLAAIVERLSATDLRLPTEADGWTIAQVLGHLAFWDRSMVVRWHAAIESARDGGALDPMRIPNELTEAVNPPLADLFGKWTERLGMAIPAEALAAAEAVDSLLESIADTIPASLVELKPFAVNRWSHRESHLDQMERALAARRTPGPPAGA